MPAADALPRRVTRKVALRTLPLLFALYVVAYLDRANVGFAKLRMSADLGFSDTVFGWGYCQSNGVFAWLLATLF